MELPPLPGFFRLHEAEIAIEIARDLPPGEAPFDAAAIEAATAAVLPGIEIVGTRLEPWERAGAPLIVADNAAHGFWVHGAAVRDWSGIDLMDGPVSLAVDGEVRATGRGPDVDGGPFGAAAWLANELAARGRWLRAGEFVTTGTLVPPVPVGPGQHVRADFGPLGTVEVRIGG
jgi:2-keto-4-pentenoate hydratase